MRYDGQLRASVRRKILDEKVFLSTFTKAVKCNRNITMYETGSNRISCITNKYVLQNVFYINNNNMICKTTPHTRKKNEILLKKKRDFTEK